MKLHHSDSGRHSRDPLRVNGRILGGEKGKMVIFHPRVKK